jgi:hypothetical protein
VNLQDVLNAKQNRRAKTLIDFSDFLHRAHIYGEFQSDGTYIRSGFFHFKNNLASTPIVLKIQIFTNKMFNNYRYIHGYFIFHWLFHLLSKFNFLNAIVLNSYEKLMELHWFNCSNHSCD